MTLQINLDSEVPTAPVENTNIDMSADVTAIRRLQPGDVLDIIIKLRKFMTQCETASFTLYACFDDLGGAELEKEAEKTRHTLELATARVATLVGSIEKIPTYVEMRRETLARRKVGKK